MAELPSHDGYRRVPQRDWENPLCSEWMDSLELAVRLAGPRTVIAAHSLGCLLTVHWLARTRLQIGGALLVAIPDPDGLNFPSRASGFAPVPRPGAALREYRKSGVHRCDKRSRRLE